MTNPHHPHSKPAVGDGQDKGADVQAMFAAIAPRYDLLNRILSLGVDQTWRYAGAREALAKAPRRVLDIATGTGDFALMLKRRAPYAQVTGSDFVPEMLEIARVKGRQAGLEVTWEEGDALALPYPDASFDTVTCTFGFRNFSDYAQGLAEMYRVLSPGGRLVILEFPPPAENLFGRVYRLYFQQVLPRIGGLVSGDSSAYTYLPESVLAFPEPEELLKMMRCAGFSARYRPLSGGIAGMWVADKR
ncbi:Ubiquinone/menaquinone biosynthesis methyltransferase ubiE [Deinococcus proteolyticus MRP]|uniref:Demethylmenaquinone methyltransferase n=1 Tax=Deinococcus proteolyticus (strain ATCC 35074 / DSM 20540 / JCM 6276 / NBRC 101906 / NCIMB 13154 / VKM Ac-1939 / CCM 2703 / MRP) TaxID=693977 RepID=F0RMQ8_DEIPM|nr:bifunctional demethylmenaquinone methyltransferase/2-methoxy-6-polyprenyl-1,4-benzoquinol methylase UbiE [Deinococcus proteolyticus]ADY27126.1 Ubiquinone/menaquinone biosynthesis methyltransferase ubiE [Deinococcus proteolyticus MRP]